MFFSEFPSCIFRPCWPRFFTWGLTAMGAAVVFLTGNVGKETLDVNARFAAGGP
jgi:hypothetical protein